LNLYSLDQVIEYLSKKISRVNLNNQKANRGGVLVKTHNGWEDKMEALVAITFQIIQSQFTRTTNDYLPGEAGLTSTSMVIGKAVARLISREPIKLEHQLTIGDLFIEGFVYHGFAELIPPTRRDESYILKATPKWEELADIPLDLVKETILGSYKEPQPINRNMHKMHDYLYDPEAPYVVAVKNLQNVGWSINAAVLDKVIAPPSELEENDAREQRRRSKVIEHRFITAKAEVLKEWDRFYQSFEIDYRGRIYNTEPFLNYQSSDMAKGLLLFSDPKPINESGKFWLAVHTASCYNQSYNINDIPEWCEEDYKTHLQDEGLEDISVDKMTLNDRAGWTMANWDKIFSCELDLKAEKPYMFLASCYEWDFVERTGMTQLPVAIDGSNNGWQHLGAISKDAHTGELVGLVPSTIQKDFYVQTAKCLIDLASKDERLTSLLQSMPMKHIRKGISKRGSMTRAYSAGAGKIAENMYFDVRAEEFTDTYGITRKDCDKLAKLLVKAIDQVCPGPLQTMAYLQELAQFQIGKHELIGGTRAEFKLLKTRRRELLSKGALDNEELVELNDVSIQINGFTYELTYGNGETTIEWDTPSGFRARYENFTTVDFKARARLNGKDVKHVLKTPTDRPNIRGFMSGISPNFIHSMDAAHMALVIAYWDGAFGAVHDSFATHASDVEDLLQKTKQVFIDMYTNDNFFDTIRQQLTNNTDSVQQPALGELDVKDINSSEYFFC
jgi:DNA-directed RNA polymerase